MCDVETINGVIRCTPADDQKPDSLGSSRDPTKGALVQAPAPLRVISALPDPPFEDTSGGAAVGFDRDLMNRVAAALGRQVEFASYDGQDFDGIFALLDSGAADVVASGATITEHRRRLALFCDPYVRSGQSLVVNPSRSPDLHTIDDLAGRVVGVQRGNTSQPVVERLLREGRLGDVRLYGYPDIRRALDDVEAGRTDGFMKLEPVMRWMIRDRPALRLVQAGITREELAVAVGRGDSELAGRINVALRALAADGTLRRLGLAWLGLEIPGTRTEVPT